MTKKEILKNRMVAELQDIYGNIYSSASNKLVIKRNIIADLLEDYKDNISLKMDILVSLLTKNIVKDVLIKSDNISLDALKNVIDTKTYQDLYENSIVGMSYNIIKQYILRDMVMDYIDTIENTKELCKIKILPYIDCFDMKVNTDSIEIIYEVEDNIETVVNAFLDILENETIDIILSDDENSYNDYIDEFIEKYTSVFEDSIKKIYIERIYDLIDDNMLENMVNYIRKHYNIDSFLKEMIEEAVDSIERNKNNLTKMQRELNNIKNVL